MTDYRTLSDSELTEALNFHRRQRNMSRGINEAAHMRQTQVVRLLEAEEARRLEEAVQVDKKNYSWGKMITVRHGSSHSFPLHPEHQEKIKNLKDGESTAFKDETGSHVTASREGDKVHLKLRGANQKTTVAHSHFTEEVELGEQIKGWKHAASDISKMRAAQGKNVKLVSLKKDGTESKMNDATKVFRSEDEAQEHHDRVTKLNPKSKIRHNLYVDGKHVKTLGESVEQLDELSPKTLHSYIKKADKHMDKLDRTIRKSDDTIRQADMARHKLGGAARKADDAQSEKSRRVADTEYGRAQRKVGTTSSAADEARKVKSAAQHKMDKRYAGVEKAYSRLGEEVEQIDEISTELKKRYVEKGAEDVVDRFTSRGKYERPRDPSKYTKTGRPKKSAVNSPESVKYRAKLDNRRDIVNKVSQEVHGKKRFGEEVEINEASDLRITKVYNKWPKPATYAVHNADRSYHKEFDSMEAAQAHKAEKSK